MDRTATQKLELAIFLYISYGFRTQCNVKVHLQDDFKICGALSRFIYEQLMSLVIHLVYLSSVKQCLLSVNRDQFLRQLKENGRHKINVSFNKWLGILAGEDLPSKLYCSENGDLKSSASNEEDELVYRVAVKPEIE